MQRMRKAEKPRSPEAEKPRSRKAKKPRSQEAQKPRSREAKKPRSRKAKKPRSRKAKKPRSREAKKPRSQEAKKPRSQKRKKIQKKKKKKNTPPISSHQSVVDDAGDAGGVAGDEMPGCWRDASVAGDAGVTRASVLVCSSVHDLQSSFHWKGTAHWFIVWTC